MYMRMNAMSIVITQVVRSDERRKNVRAHPPTTELVNQLIDTFISEVRIYFCRSTATES